MVYFVQQGESGPIKIGVAENYLRRLDQLQAANSEMLRLRALIPGSYAEERVLHRRFDGGRIQGEWFAADTPGLAEFLSRAGAREPSTLFPNSLRLSEQETWDLQEELEDLAA